MRAYAGVVNPPLTRHHHARQVGASLNAIPAGGTRKGEGLPNTGGHDDERGGFGFCSTVRRLTVLHRLDSSQDVKPEASARPRRLSPSVRRFLTRLYR